MAARKIHRRNKRRRVKTTLFQLHADPRETPIYSVTEAAAYVGVPRSTLRHWLASSRRTGAILETPNGSKDLSFYNLLEAHILRVAIERHVKLPRLRVMAAELRERAPNEAHPLLKEELFTGGPFRTVFIKTLSGQIEDVGHGSQLALRQLVSKFLTRIDRDQNGPYRLRPYNYRHVALDHRVSGGQPVVLGTGIMVEMIARRHRAGESVEFLAQDYHIKTADVREAIKYAA